MFLAIAGFIFFGLIIVIGLLASTFLAAFNQNDTNSGVPEWFYLVIFLILVVVDFLPVLFLFRFSKYTSSAVSTLNKKELHIAIKNLKLFFVYFGVLFIIVITLYIVGLVVAGTSLEFIKGL